MTDNDNSEEQFTELLGQLVARVNKALVSSPSVEPMGLMLCEDGSVKVSIALITDEMTLNDGLNHIQEQLKVEAKDKKSLASCISYADYQNGQIIAYLENRENYCSRILIPVKTNPEMHLDPENGTVEDGEIYVFGKDT